MSSQQQQAYLLIFTRCLYVCYCILLHHFIVFAVNFISCVTPLVCMSWFAFVRLIKETTYLQLGTNKNSIEM